MTVERKIDEFPHAPLARWSPEFPAGRIETIYLHWSGGDYETVYTSYHYCIALKDGAPVVVETHDLRANMRRVESGDAAYAMHTLGRNSFAAGIAVMAMRDASPADFGAFPLTNELVDALCAVAARVAHAYAIPIDGERVRTHAEAALLDGYFGLHADDERWDIALLTPQARALEPRDAIATAEELRRRIASIEIGG
jgi:hypothetical protein